jgi:hypothetical protein
MLKRLKDWAMFDAATLAGAHSEGNGASSQDAVSGAMLMRLVGEMQAACLRTRGMAVAVLSSVRAWKRVEKSMLSDGDLAKSGVSCASRFKLLGLPGSSSLFKQRRN